MIFSWGQKPVDPVLDSVDDLILHFEGCKLKSYYCPGNRLTIGIGHTGPDVYEGQQITKAEANRLFAQDVHEARTALQGRLPHGLQPHQVGAIVSLVFNIGAGKFLRSNLYRHLMAGEYGHFDLSNAWNDPSLAGLTGMAKHWAQFRLSKGKVERGLVRRRAAELELFFTGEWTSTYSMPQSVDGLPDEPPQIFRPGMRGPVVSQLHEALKVAGFNVEPMDAYTFVTKEAVAEFQRSAGLLVDGLYGPITADALNDRLRGAA